MKRFFQANFIILQAINCHLYLPFTGIIVNNLNTICEQLSDELDFAGVKQNSWILFSLL